MAAQTVIFSTAQSNTCFSGIGRSSFLGVSVKSTTRQAFSLTAVALRRMTVVADEDGGAVLKGNSAVEGVFMLTQENDGPTNVKVRGPHGFHLHEFGDTTNGCISTGPHFNPKGLTHGSPEDEIRHASDLGNIVANPDGVAEVTIVDNQVPLTGPNALVGRAFVVHELEDDLGKGVIGLTPT